MGGGVSHAILDAGGASIQTDARKHTPLKIGDVIVTSAGDLPAKYIFHAVTLDYTEMISPSEDSIRTATIRCMELADSLRVKSIAFPALGTGVGDFPFQLAAEVMTQTIADYLLGKTQIELVVISLFTRDIVNEQNLNIFYERSAAHASTYSQSKRLSILLSELKQIADRAGNATVLNHIKSLEAEIKNANIVLSERTVDLARLEELTDNSQIGEIGRKVVNVSSSVREAATDAWIDSKLDEKILRTKLSGLQTQLNIKISNLNEYQIEEAKYGGIMVPPRLKTAILDLQEQISQIESDVSKVRTDLVKVHQKH
jgi:O-acetyl-ADP-ribose deacetylase (regulator of RNase III)